jgi:hypothetical protein
MVQKAMLQGFLAKKNPGRTGANQPGRKKSNHVAGERRPINTLQASLLGNGVKRM